MPLPEEYAPRAGDEIAVQSGRNTIKYEIQQIRRISPKGVITLKDGRKFSKTGMPVPFHLTNTETLMPLTDELRARLQRAKRIEYFNNFPLKNMPDEFLDELVAFFNARGFNLVK